MKKNGLLLMATILIWGTVWYAIKFQLGVTPVIVSVFYRILLAAAFLSGLSMFTSPPQKLTPSDHIYLVLMGLLLFSANYYLFYIATGYIQSGLVSLVFSTLVIVNSINKRIFFGEKISGSIIFGGTVGITGVLLLFGSELGDTRYSSDRLSGILYAFFATYLVSLGNIVSARCSKRNIPVLSSTSYGLCYGAVLCGGFILWQGYEFTIPFTAVYLSSLVYLSLFCTAIAFLLYLNLVKSAGPDKAAIATMLFPVVAMAISSVLEGYSWTPSAIAGVGLILIGSSLSFLGGRLKAAIFKL